MTLRLPTDRRRFRAADILAAFLLAVSAFALPAWAVTIVGRVVGVSDGDTITVLDADHVQHRIRLAGIDAPEKAQLFGQRAKQALSDLAYGKEALLECAKTDRYGRSVCKVMVAPTSAPNGPKTLDAGLAMITVGLAWWYRAYAREQTPTERGQYEFAEFEAKAKRVGLWRDADAVAPWEWRADRRAGTQPN